MAKKDYNWHMLSLAQQDLVKRIRKDKSLDEQSRNELLGGFNNWLESFPIKIGVGHETDLLTGRFESKEKLNTQQVEERLLQAKEGISPKFKSRRAVEEMYKAIADRPGSRQTRSQGLLSVSGPLVPKLGA